MANLPPTSERTTTLKAFSLALRREAHVLINQPDLLWQQWKKAAQPLQDRQQQTESSF